MIKERFNVNLYSRTWFPLFAEHNDLKFAVPGGLIGVGTKVDPTLCRADRLVGQVVGAKGNLPSIYADIEINYFPIKKIVGCQN